LSSSKRAIRSSAIFEKFEECGGEYASYAEEAIFEYAFKLGAKLMLETIE
jgi:hypothetical protein